MMTKFIKLMALNTVRHRYWAPGRGLRTFLDESIPEEIGPLIGEGATVEDLVSGWWWKNLALQLSTEEIEERAAQIQAELKRRTENGEPLRPIELRPDDGAVNLEGKPGE